MAKLPGHVKLYLQPITKKEVWRYIKNLHRHHKPPTGGLFWIACNDGEKIVGVAVVGRPKAKALQDGYTCEVTRLCTDGTPNACSFLYNACVRAATALGYKRVITYILKGESGASLHAAGWKFRYLTAGGSWNRPSRPRVDVSPTDQKQLWSPEGHEIGSKKERAKAA